jgi:DNA-directed RNA polymerase specialized sigma24 family protein
VSDAGPSITVWLERLKQGDAVAARPLWERNFGRLAALARQALCGMPRRAADEEDVALEAFDSFCRGVAQGRFPRLTDRHDLWALLVVLTERRASDLREHEGAQKRGGGKVRGGSVLAKGEDSEVGADAFDRLAGPEPTPEFAAQVAEECRRLLEVLAEADLRQIALWKLEGYTNAEIARRLGCVTTTVERRLRLIRALWEKEVTRE